MYLNFIWIYIIHVYTYTSICIHEKRNFHLPNNEFAMDFDNNYFNYHLNAIKGYLYTEMLLLLLFLVFLLSILW